MPQVEREISQRLHSGKNGLLVIRDGVAGTPVRVKATNTRFLNAVSDTVGAAVTVGADKVVGLQYGTGIGIDAAGSRVAISGPAGATYSRARVTISGPTDVEAALVAGGMDYLPPFDYPATGDLVIRLDGDALASSPPKTIAATPAAANTLSGTLRDVSNLYEAGQGLALMPGTVVFTLDLATSGSVAYRDLNGDGLLYGPHGWGTVDYLTGDYELHFAELVDPGTAFEVDFEATLNTQTSRLAADVLVQYTAYDNADGL